MFPSWGSGVLVVLKVTRFLVSDEAFGFALLLYLSTLKTRVAPNPNHAYTPMVVGRRRDGGESCLRPWLVANRGTVPQKWPPPPRNVAEECELTFNTKPRQSILFFLAERFTVRAVYRIHVALL